MKIGVLSDSHRKVGLAKFVIKTLKREGAQFLIHAGDIVEDETLHLLELSGLPYKAIMGNNDTHLIAHVEKFQLHQEPYYFAIDELNVKLMHHPFYLVPDADLIIYGHTHHFSVEYVGQTLFLNPGEVCARKKDLCECVLLDGNKSQWTLKHFTCKPEKRDWKIETKVFKS